MKTFVAWPGVAVSTLECGDGWFKTLNGRRLKDLNVRPSLSVDLKHSYAYFKALKILSPGIRGQLLLQYVYNL